MRIRFGCGGSAIWAQVSLMAISGVLAAAGAYAQSSAPMTNAAIVQLVQQRVPDATIMRSIEAGPVQFDLSHAGLLALERRGVDGKVLMAMMAKGGLASSGPGIAAYQPTKISALRPGAIVRNPSIAELNFQRMNLLHRQRQAADTEATRVMRIAIRPPGPPAMLGQPSQLMSATVNPTTGAAALAPPASPASQPTSSGGSGGLLIPSGSGTGGPVPQGAAPPATPTPQPTPGGGGGGSGGPLNASGSGSGEPVPQGTAPRPIPTPQPTPGGGGGGSGGVSNPFGSGPVRRHAVRATTGNAAGGGGSRFSPATRPQLSPATSLILLCTQNPAMRILSVSGSVSPATFTPIDAYNLYTITGCSFGNPGADAQVYIYGTGAFRGNFVVKYWSDNSIVVSLDSSISGVPDLDNLTLVVQRADMQQAQKGGFSFYAARQTVLLSRIPSSWVKLATLENISTILPATLTSPPNPVLGPSAGSATVGRFLPNAKFDPTTQDDYYAFDQLAAGWTATAFQVEPYAPNCPGDPYTITYKQEFGFLLGRWDGHNIKVALFDTSCSGLIVLAPWENYQNWTSSFYALKVWVTGPRGTDPFTDNPAQ